MAQLQYTTLDSWTTADPFINKRLRALLGRKPATIYEAGGGSKSILGDLVDGAHVVVVDISPEQIARCMYAAEAIEGNIESWRRADAFDVVCCNNVLEHVEDANSALASLAASVKPGGVCVITGPAPNSLKGWATRFTPHWLHVWYYRYTRGVTNAGKPGYPPFHTCFAPGSRPRDMAGLLSASGLRIDDLVFYAGREVDRLKERSALVHGVYAFVCGSLRVLSLDQHQAHLTDFILIASKAPSTVRPHADDCDAPQASELDAVTEGAR